MFSTFFTGIKDKYNYLTSIGTLAKNSNEVNKKIKLLNVYATIWIHIIIFYLFFDNILRTTIFVVNFSFSIGLMAMLSVYLLNYKQKSTLAKSILLAYNMFHFFVVSCLMNNSWGLEYYFLLIPCIALSLYQNVNIARVLLVISFLLFLLPTYVFNKYPVEYKEQFLPHALIGLFAGIFMLVLYYKKSNENNEYLLAIERDKALSDKTIIENQAQELTELNEFKSHFFINLSHEIRTPITLIKGYASKIKYENKENQQNLDIVNSQIQQIEGILNDILDLSKLDANKLDIFRVNTEIAPLLNKHYANFKGLFNKKNIDFNIDVNLENVKIDMDPSLISKCINNLLNNALKFTPNNGKVSIEAYLSNSLEIRIIDNGIGIPKKDLEKIFERFYQSKNHVTKSQGSGIGLAFTKSIIESHDFTISVSSIPDKETVFKIVIPTKYISHSENIVNTRIIEDAIETENEESKNFILNKRKKTILVVDDHPQMRNYLISTLKEYNTVEAENGKEALAILKSKKIDLLLTDYMMPVMDGATLVKEVKKANYLIPIIVLTARTDNDAKLNMLRIGVDGYLNKPFVDEELLLLIKSSLKLYAKIIETQQTLDPKEKELITINNKGKEFLEEITGFIEKNITRQDFHVEEIATHLNFSQSTLNRRTKSLLGLTTKQLITQVKIEKARNLHLQNPYLSKKEIGYKVGITNTSYLFNKIAENYGSHYNVTD